jgi:hypothetical protein
MLEVESLIEASTPTYWRDHEIVESTSAAWAAQLSIHKGRVEIWSMELPGNRWKNRKKGGLCGSVNSQKYPWSGSCGIHGMFRIAWAAKMAAK